MRAVDGLRPRRGARRVVEGGGGVLVGLPGPGLGVELEQHSVGFVADHEPVSALDVGHGIGEFGIDEEHRGAALLDDVAHLLGMEAEVDRHQHPTPSAHPEERHEQARRVVTDDGDAFAHADAQRVDGGGERRRVFPELAVSQRTPTERGRGLIGLIDHRSAIGVHPERSVEVITDVQVDLHEEPFGTRRTGRWRIEVCLFERPHSMGPVDSNSSTRSARTSNMTVSSRRARAAPRQWWMP